MGRRTRSLDMFPSLDAGITVGIYGPSATQLQVTPLRAIAPNPSCMIPLATSRCCGVPGDTDFRRTGRHSAGTDCPIADLETQTLFKGLAERPDMPGAAWRYCANECECIWDRLRCEEDDECAVSRGLKGCSDPKIKCGWPGSDVSRCCPVTCGLCSRPGSGYHLDSQSSFGFKGLRGGCAAASGEGAVFGGLSWYVLMGLYVA